MRYFFVISILIGLAISFCGADNFAIDGYLKNYSTMIKLPPVSGSSETDPYGQASYRLNLKLTYSPFDFLALKAAYDFQPTIIANSDETSILDLWGEVSGPTYRTDELRSPLWPDEFDGSGFVIYQNLDRLYASVELPFADVLLGRQPIAWGNAHAVNPTDIFAPFALDALDTEDRPGVDALRMRIPLGMMSELDIGALPGEKWSEETAAAFARGKFYVKQTDFALTGILFRQDLLLGFDMTRAIGGAGTWLEFALVQPAIMEDSFEEDLYSRLSLGAEYVFGGETYVFGEYHYNGAGESEPKNYFSLFTNRAYTQGGVYLMGEHYLITGGGYQITPLISSSGQIIFNAIDYSALIAPNIEYNYAENVYISLGAIIGTGPAMSQLIIDPLGNFSLDLKSEFGNYPDMAYASFRIYF